MKSDQIKETLFMKRTIFTLLIIGFLFGCSGCSKLTYYNEVTEKELICNMYPVKLYYNNDNDTYAVVVYEDMIPTKGVSFSSDRIASNIVNMNLVEINNIESYIGRPFSEVEKELGKFETDIGSGARMPSYITPDGYLICFTISNYSDVICHTGKTDLLTGEGVEWYFLR